MEYLSSYVSGILLTRIRKNNISEYTETLKKYEEAVKSEKHYKIFYEDFYQYYCRNAHNVVQKENFDKLLLSFILPSGTRMKKNKESIIIKKFIGSYVSECSKLCMINIDAITSMQTNLDDSKRDFDALLYKCKLAYEKSLAGVVSNSSGAIEILSERLSASEEKNKELKAKLLEAENKIAELKAKLLEAENKIAELNSIIDKLNKESTISIFNT